MTEIDRSLLRRQSVEDSLVSVFKSVVGNVPAIGSAVVEVFTQLIPEQRIDRLATFCGQLATALEARTLTPGLFVAQFIDSPAFAFLTEEILGSAARTASDQRRQHLAALLASGVSMDQAALEHQRTLLKLLDQLNDNQVVILILYAGIGLYGDTEVREAYLARHKHVFAEPATNGSTDEQVEAHAMYEHYEKQLVSLSLLREKPGPFQGAVRREPSTLGRMLTRQIYGTTDIDHLKD